MQTDTTTQADAPESLPQPTELSLEDALKLAITLHRQGQLGLAEALYQRILTAFPSQPDALTFLGVLTHQRGDSDQGLALIQEAIGIDPGFSDRHLNLGTLLAECGRLEEAATAYRTAIQLAQDDGTRRANACNNLGAVLRYLDRPGEAFQAYEQAIAADPRFAEAYNNLGNLLESQGRHDDALRQYLKALVIAPRNGQSRKLMGMAHYALGQLDEAAQVYREWLAEEPDNPVAHHLLAACSGNQVPERASDAFVASTFDAFAQSFDEKLARLGYQAPALVVEAALARFPDGTDTLQVLDAGCGTGLCGPLLRPRAQRLVGVDLSSGMLEQARHRGTYDQLVHGELTEYLRSLPASFDLVISADTLVYFGGLDDVFHGMAGGLRPGGVLAFTVEALDGPGPSAYQLNPHGRYSHRRGPLEQALAAQGFTGITVEPATLRSEGRVPVLGYVVTARKPEVSPGRSTHTGEGGRGPALDQDSPPR